MTASNEVPLSPPPPAPAPDSDGKLRNAVLLAGVLGGLLGAIGGFALNRWLPARPPQVVPSPSDARLAGENLIELLKAGRYSEFIQLHRAGRPTLTADTAATLQKTLEESRASYAATNGRPTGEFELVRESPLGQSLTRLVYLEKFARGGIVWTFGLYAAPDGWQLFWVTVEPLETALPALR